MQFYDTEEPGNLFLSRDNFTYSLEQSSHQICFVCTRYVFSVLVCCIHNNYDAFCIYYIHVCISCFCYMQLWRIHAFVYTCVLYIALVKMQCVILSVLFCLADAVLF